MCLYSRYTFPVHVCLICTPLDFTICTRGLHLTTLNSHVQILEPGLWWLSCNWSECAVDPPMVVRVQQKLRRRRSSSFQLFSCLALEVSLTAREHLSTYVYSFMYCTFISSGDIIFLLYCITLCDDHVLYYFVLECILSLCFRLWFLPILMLSVYTSSILVATPFSRILGSGAWHYA